jgi:HSP20 family protein
MCHSNNSQRYRDHQSRGYGAAHAGFNPFRWQANATRVPVNIRESKDWYELFVYAPGLTKDAFQVNLSSDVLSIKVAAKEQGGQENWLHYEYPRNGFERQFSLNGKVDTSAITARYTDGVLELTLPKLPGTEAQEITIS